MHVRCCDFFFRARAFFARSLQKHVRGADCAATVADRRCGYGDQAIQSAIGPRLLQILVVMRDEGRILSAFWDAGMCRLEWMRETLGGLLCFFAPALRKNGAPRGAVA